MKKLFENILRILLGLGYLIVALVMLGGALLMIINCCRVFIGDDTMIKPIVMLLIGALLGMGGFLVGVKSWALLSGREQCVFVMISPEEKAQFLQKVKSSKTWILAAIMVVIIIIGTIIGRFMPL